MPRKRKENSTNLSIWHKNIPLLYDTILQKKLECPSYACTFGSLISEGRNFNTYRLFQSRATNANYLKDKHIWQGLPHALLICNVDLPHPHHTQLTTHYDEVKRIIHPGPILRIKQHPEFPQIVATHTQHKYVFLWNTSTQHDREMQNNSDPNTPELILKGHKKDAVYALDFSHQDYGVASGSKDNRICVWNIADYGTVLSADTEPDKKERFVPLSKPSPKLKPRIILKGHSNEVTDVEFAPNSPFMIASVSLDKSFKVWDIRLQNEMDNNTAQTLHNAHEKEITNVSWNRVNTQYIVTAASDGCIKLLDMRKSTNNTDNKCCVLREFKGHQNKISSLQWNPSSNNVNYFLSSSHDGSVMIWNINNNDNNGMVFNHIGHMNYAQKRQVIHSASWIKMDNSWCIASTSSPKAFVPFFWSSSSDKKMNIDSNGNNTNPNDISEGGIMHIWRPSMLLKMHKNDVIKHLKQKKSIKLIDDVNDAKKNKKKKKKKGKNNMDNNEDMDIDTIHLNDKDHQ